jgi:hypothetical protein
MGDDAGRGGRDGAVVHPEGPSTANGRDSLELSRCRRARATNLTAACRSARAALRGGARRLALASRTDSLATGKRASLCRQGSLAGRHAWHMKRSAMGETADAARSGGSDGDRCGQWRFAAPARRWRWGASCRRRSPTRGSERTRRRPTRRSTTAHRDAARALSGDRQLRAEHLQRSGVQFAADSVDGESAPGPGFGPVTRGCTPQGCVPNLYTIWPV